MSCRAIDEKVDYRSDIDVLRCIAILAVLLYHFRVKPINGGFVGVDIFFVISGYLITGILFKASSKGVLSFSSFYSRRARRLVPALLATTLLSFVASYFVFFPEDFARQSRGTIATLLGASNVLFWMESGYFDVSSMLKPLLHSWSLSVEFQFYAFWPLLIWFIAKAKREWVTIAALTTTAAVSFLACLYILSMDSPAGFFLMPFRVWEFAIGGLVFFLERRRLQNGQVLEALYLVGLVANIACLVAYSKDTPFPGWTALPPVLATALMIYAGPRARAAAFLNRWQTRFIGQISYSLYLVHWPILVFGLYLFGPNLRPLQTLALIGLTFLVAILMFRLVESPLRSHRAGSISPLAFNAACIAVIACLIVPAAYGWTSKGLWAWRLPQAAVINALNAYDVESAKAYVWEHYDEFQRPDDFRTNKLRMLIVGDSQSADILNMLVEAGVDNKIEIITRKVHYECGLPYLDKGERDEFWSGHNPMTMNSPNLTEACNLVMDRLVSSPAIKNADVVLVGFLWQEFARPYLKRSLDAVAKTARGQLWVAGSKTFSASSARMVNDLAQINGIEHYAAGLIPRETQDINQFLKETYGSRFIDMLSSICPSKQSCHVLTDEYKPVLWDSRHFTKEGAIFVWKQGGRELFSFLEP
jgi:peptidoglycan/LPS O-acetylase OafA/YrhL